MGGVILLTILLFLISQVLFSFFKKRHKFFSKKKMNFLFVYHYFFFGVYYWYSQLNNSDSHLYFKQVQNDALSWGDYYGTSTRFIHFLSYNFINNFGFSYEMIMLLFSWFGYLGFVFAYVFFREYIPLKIKVFKKIDLLTLILFFPNMHFWTASLGKGAPIFLGLMMFAYGIGNPKSRILILIFGSLLTYHIRPHIFMFLAIGTILGYMSGKEKIAFWKKALVYIGMLGGLVLAKDQILAVVNLSGSDDLVTDLSTFTEERSSDLSQSGSGVNMESYPLPLKLFTFWFRPLFFDAPGILGIIISFENLIYLILSTKILKKDFLDFVKKSPVVIKMSLTVFLMTSLAMTFVMSNLGIIMRQKSMIMYFLFFVIFYYLAQKKYDGIIKLKNRRKSFQSRKLVNS